MLVAFGERVEPRADHLVGFRIELAERQVLELLAHLMHAHAAGERRVDFQRLLGGAAARLGRHVVERAHVVQPVGELDQQHAHVVGDRQQQLAQVFRLLGFLGDEVELLQLGEALDQRADVAPEQAVDLGARGCGILDGVVQQRGGDGRVVELEVGEDRRHFDRMREIRIARGAPLLAMRLHGVDIGAVEQRLVGIRDCSGAPARSGRIAASSCGLRDLRQAFQRLARRGNGRARAAPGSGDCFCMRGRSERARAIQCLAAAESVETGRRSLLPRYHGVFAVAARVWRVLVDEIATARLVGRAVASN